MSVPSKARRVNAGLNMLFIFFKVKHFKGEEIRDVKEVLGKGEQN